MTAENPPLGKSSTNSRAVLAAATIAGLIAGGLLAFFFLQEGAGDEPPIRVKNRSIEFELVHGGRKWKELSQEDKMHWKMSKGTKNTADFEIYVAPTDTAKCAGGVFKTGSKVTFTYGDGTTADIDVTIDSDDDNKTTLTSTKPLEYGKKPNGSDNEKVLLYKGEGVKFIQKITVEAAGSPVVVCTFQDKDDKLAAIVVEAVS